jgi:hypothetical protein
MSTALVDLRASPTVFRISQPPASVQIRARAETVSMCSRGLRGPNSAAFERLIDAGYCGRCCSVVPRIGPGQDNDWVTAIWRTRLRTCPLTGPPEPCPRYARGPRRGTPARRHAPPADGRPCASRPPASWVRGRAQADTRCQAAHRVGRCPQTAGQPHHRPRSTRISLRVSRPPPRCAEVRLPRARPLRARTRAMRRRIEAVQRTARRQDPRSRFQAGRQGGGPAQAPPTDVPKPARSALSAHHPPAARRMPHRPSGPPGRR